MQQVNDKLELRQAMQGYKSDGLKTAFVPTLGNLHDGHLSLVSKAKRIADRVVVSIFLNPTQFDKPEDLDAYPITLESDLALLKEEGVDLVFLPGADEMYPEGSTTSVVVGGLSAILEGESRPGHFSGVATVVAKLFNLVRPDIAVFGEKDFQQLMLIRRLVRDLDFDIEIVAGATIREQSGLAMSSRNNYLTDEQRNEIAPALYKELLHIRDQILGGDTDYQRLQADSARTLDSKGFKTDYIDVRCAADLSLAGPDHSRLVVLASAWLGKARLIDNVEFETGTAQ